MTKHQIVKADSSNLDFINDSSINLIVTSPPYPMVEMWDELFIDQDSEIRQSIDNKDGYTAFTRMHNVLNKVWKECDRVLSDHGFICINIGDAVRTIGGVFQLYPNHVKIIEFFASMGYNVLPDILWRKPSNAPNKFMGSGMYPAGAYVTYEHEHILIFRKGEKRPFTNEEKETRQKSAYFWEERNSWCSDLGEIKGTSQNIPCSSARDRNASFPFEIPYRLVNMYSVENDVVLDPFCGLGTTSLACMVAQRSSIGVEKDEGIASLARDRLNTSPEALNKIIKARIAAHKDFIDSIPQEKKNRCYYNTAHNVKVKTKQETKLFISPITSISADGSIFTCKYDNFYIAGE